MEGFLLKVHNIYVLKTPLFIVLEHAIKLKAKVGGKLTYERIVKGLLLLIFINKSDFKTACLVINKLPK